MTEEEISKYTMTPKKFTRQKERRNEFAKDGWREEGKDFYKKTWDAWRQFASDSEVWSRLVMRLGEYMKDENFCKILRKKGPLVSRESEGEEEVSDEEEDSLFVLPGDAGFEMDRPWQQGRGDTNDEEARRVSKFPGDDRISHSEMVREINNAMNSCSSSDEDDSDSSVMVRSGLRENLQEVRGYKYSAKKRKVEDDLVDTDEN